MIVLGQTRRVYHPHGLHSVSLKFLSTLNLGMWPCLERGSDAIESVKPHWVGGAINQYDLRIIIRRNLNTGTHERVREVKAELETPRFASQHEDLSQNHQKNLP